MLEYIYQYIKYVKRKHLYTDLNLYMKIYTNKNHNFKKSSHVPDNRIFYTFIKINYQLLTLILNKWNTQPDWNCLTFICADSWNLSSLW